MIEKKEMTKSKARSLRGDRVAHRSNKKEKEQRRLSENRPVGRRSMILAPLAEEGKKRNLRKFGKRVQWPLTLTRMGKTNVNGLDSGRMDGWSETIEISAEGEEVSPPGIVVCTENLRSSAAADSCEKRKATNAKV